MTSLHYQGHSVDCRAGESVLDAFVRAGLDIPFSCKSGVCRRCMVKRIDGDLPPQAAIKLPQRLQEAGYLLACQCKPTTDLVLAPRSLEDMLTTCMLMSVDFLVDGNLLLSFEPCTELEFHAGQPARLVGGDIASEPDLVLTGRDNENGWVQARLMLNGRQSPAWLSDADAAFGAEFEIRGPFPSEPKHEVPSLPTDPALWVALDNGKIVRSILDTFYQRVYKDPLLKPYFERVTMDRVIGKQYAFLMQSITGEQVYIGERPRNSHHWMVIPDSVFDHRQKLMLDAQREHGLNESLIERWSRYEEHFRPDIVKYTPWPKRIGDQVIDTERYESIELDEATVCDHCGGEIAAGTTVRYHMRLGLVGCAACTQHTAVSP